MPIPYKKYTKFLCVIIFIIFSLQGCGSKTTTEDNSNSTPDTSKGSITGIVVASSSITFKALKTAFQEAPTAGVPGAVCSIEGTDKNAATDEHGSFTISDVSPGSYIIICRKTASDGNIFAFLNSVEVQTGKTTDIGTIQVTQTRDIQGKATLADQTTHTGISVYIPGITSMQAETNAAGAYVINNVPEGTYNLFFEKDGYVTASLNITVPSGETAVASDVTLSTHLNSNTTYDPVVHPNISVNIAQPTQGAIANTPLLIAVKVNSLYELKDVKARVQGVEADLSFSNNAVCSKGGCSPGWSGSISLTGLERGEKLLIVKASDVFGNITEATRSFIFDKKPVLSVTDPMDGTVARPQLHISASCTDDDPVGCTSIKVKIGETVVATGQSGIDENVSLASFDGRQVTLRFEAKDSANQVIAVERVIYVEASSVLTEVETVSGSIFDVEPNRILFLDNAGADLILKIRNRVTDEDTTIPVIPGKVPQYGFLTPKGAIIIAQDNGSRLYEWRDGSFANIDFPNSNNYVNSKYSLKVIGNYAIWNMEKTLILRDLLSGTNTIVSTNTGNTANDVATNGDVVYWAYDYAVYRYSGGTTTRLTNDSTLWNTYPLTDGINVVYRKHTSCCDNQTYAIVMYGNSGEKTLASARSQEPNPGFDYQLNNGWIAFTKSGSDSKLQVWVHSPSGQETKLTFWGTSSSIAALSPEGEVTFINGNRMYLSGPGLNAIEIGPSLGRSFWQNGQWYVTIGRSLFRVEQ